MRMSLPVLCLCLEELSEKHRKKRKYYYRAIKKKTFYFIFKAALLAQWVKCWPNDLASLIPGSRNVFNCKCSSFIIILPLS